MSSVFYSLSGAIAGIAVAALLIFLPSEYQTASGNQISMFTAELDEGTLDYELNVHAQSASEREIRVILASPYANVATR